MTLPLLQGLYRQWDAFPPTALLAAGLAQQFKAKPISEGIQSLGIPIKKGKVKRGDISR
jgi:hypothetical protein